MLVEAFVDLPALVAGRSDEGLSLAELAVAYVGLAHVVASGDAGRRSRAISIFNFRDANRGHVQE